MIFLLIKWDHWWWPCVSEAMHFKCYFLLEPKPFLGLAVCGPSLNIVNAMFISLGWTPWQTGRPYTFIYGLQLPVILPTNLLSWVAGKFGRTKIHTSNFGDLLAYLHAVHNNKWPQKVPLYPLSPLYILTICCIVITIQYWKTSSAQKQESIIHQISSILRNRLKDSGNQTFESYVKRKQLAQTWSSVVVLKIKVPVYT